MKPTGLIFSGIGAFLGSSLLSTTASFAAQPEPWQIWHQPAGSAMMASIEWFDSFTLWIITAITLFVMALLAYVMLKFRAGANPEPSKTSHNTAIEVVWTVAPILILIAIALPSFQLLESQFDPGEEPTVTVKAIGQSWAWDYEYQDESELAFSSYLINQQGQAIREGDEGYEQAQIEEREIREELGKTDIETYPRLLAVDNELVVPVNETIRVLVTADPTGVIHNFALPAFGLKMDAIPGRTNETWFKAQKEGIYYGQCSELCGQYHSFMPIAIRVVNREQYDAWKSAAVDDIGDANKILKASIDQDRKLKLAGNQAGSEVSGDTN